MRLFSPILAAIALGLLPLPQLLCAFEFEGVHVYAHRGAGFEYDENTVAAGKQSYENGIRGFETDLRLSKDQKLVLMHDATLTRTTGAQGAVETKTVTEIASLRTIQNQQPVPLFSDWVDYFKDKPDAKFLLELKTSDTQVYTDEILFVYVKAVAKEVKALPQNSYWFTSFDPRVLALIKKELPSVPTGLLTSSTPTPEMIETAKRLGCSRLSLSLDLTTRAYIREVKKAGLQVSLYPIKSREDAHLAVAMGTHILCTDVPSVLLGH